MPCVRVAHTSHYTTTHSTGARYRPYMYGIKDVTLFPAPESDAFNTFRIRQALSSPLERQPDQRPAAPPARRPRAITVHRSAVAPAAAEEKWKAPPARSKKLPYSSTAGRRLSHAWPLAALEVAAPLSPKEAGEVGETGFTTCSGATCTYCNPRLASPRRRCRLARPDGEAWLPVADARNAARVLCWMLAAPLLPDVSDLAAFAARRGPLSTTVTP